MISNTKQRDMLLPYQTNHKALGTHEMTLTVIKIDNSAIPLQYKYAQIQI